MCENYLLSSHKLDIIKILENPVKEKYFSVNINFLELFESNTNLGNALLTDPEASLKNWDESVFHVQSDLVTERTINYTLKNNVTCRIFNLPPWPHVCRTVFPGNEDANTFLQVTGTVVRMSARKLLEYQRQYVCVRCKFPITVEAQYDKRNIIKQPKKCPNPAGCTSKHIITFGELDTYNCKDYQEIKIQEDLSKLGVGTVPNHMIVTLEDDLVNVCKPGENVTITGIVKRRWSEFEKGVKIIIDIALKANHIQVNNSSGLAIAVSQDMMQFFQSFWEMHIDEPLVARNIILKSISPEIYGLHLVKLAIAVVLASGSRNQESEISTGIDTRAESHLLFVGDPGTGKSQILRFASKIIPRSVLTTGVGSTAAGLTVTAVMENGDWQLEAGALVMADGGICCIDEFNSMKEHDRTSIHEAMEQQTISVAKAGIVCKLKTRCSILAACNPKGNIDPTQPLCVNVAMSSPLLSRFDLILLLRDVVNEDNDRRLANHILNNGSTFEIDTWNLEKLQAYYAVIKKSNPKLTLEAETILSTYYQLQRKFGSRNKSRTTVRLLESLIRLSQGHAKLMYHAEVQVLDAIFAVALTDSAMDFESSLLNLKIDNNTFFENPEQLYCDLLENILGKLNLNYIYQREIETGTLQSTTAKSSQFMSQTTENTSHHFANIGQGSEENNDSDGDGRRSIFQKPAPGVDKRLTSLFTKKCPKFTNQSRHNTEVKASENIPVKKLSECEGNANTNRLPGLFSQQNFSRRSQNCSQSSSYDASSSQNVPQSQQNNYPDDKRPLFQKSEPGVAQRQPSLFIKNYPAFTNQGGRNIEEEASEISPANKLSECGGNTHTYRPRGLFSQQNLSRRSQNCSQLTSYDASSFQNVPQSQQNNYSDDKRPLFQKSEPGVAQRQPSLFTKNYATFKNQDGRNIEEETSENSPAKKLSECGGNTHTYRPRGLFSQHNLSQRSQNVGQSTSYDASSQRSQNGGQPSPIVELSKTTSNDVTSSSKSSLFSQSRVQRFPAKLLNDSKDSGNFSSMTSLNSQSINIDESVEEMRKTILDNRENKLKENEVSKQKGSLFRNNFDSPSNSKDAECSKKAGNYQRELECAQYLRESKIKPNSHKKAMTLSEVVRSNSDADFDFELLEFPFMNKDKSLKNTVRKADDEKKLEESGFASQPEHEESSKQCGKNTLFNKMESPIIIDKQSNTNPPSSRDIESPKVIETSQQDLELSDRNCSNLLPKLGGPHKKGMTLSEIVKRNSDINLDMDFDVDLDLPFMNKNKSHTNKVERASIKKDKFVAQNLHMENSILIGGGKDTPEKIKPSINKEKKTSISPIKNPKKAKATAKNTVTSEMDLIKFMPSVNDDFAKFDMDIDWDMASQVHDEDSCVETNVQSLVVPESEGNQLSGQNNGRFMENLSSINKPSDSFKNVLASDRNSKKTEEPEIIQHSKLKKTCGDLQAKFSFQPRDKSKDQTSSNLVHKDLMKCDNVTNCDHDEMARELSSKNSIKNPKKSKGTEKRAVTNGIDLIKLMPSVNDDLAKFDMDMESQVHDDNSCVGTNIQSLVVPESEGNQLSDQNNGRFMENLSSINKPSDSFKNVLASDRYNSKKTGESESIQQSKLKRAFGDFHAKSDFRPRDKSKDQTSSNLVHKDLMKCDNVTNCDNYVTAREVFSTNSQVKEIVKSGKVVSKFAFKNVDLDMEYLELFGPSVNPFDKNKSKHKGC